MKTVRFTILNSLIIAGLSVGMAGSAFASQAPTPAPQASKSLLSYVATGLGKGLWYSLTNPGKTSIALAGLSALYLTCCRWSNNNCKPTISDAKRHTKKLDLTSNHPSTPNKKYRYWNLAFGSGSEIAANHNPRYWELYELFKKADESEQAFINRTNEAINIEKNDIEIIRAKLDKCLDECTILPRLSDYRTELDNPVETLISNYLQAQKKTHLYQLSLDHIKLLDQEIKKLATPAVTSLFCKTPLKYFNWHRFYAVPNEADVIEQYWKIYQMMDHLSAIQFCFNERQKVLNMAV